MFFFGGVGVFGVFCGGLGWFWMFWGGLGCFGVIRWTGRSQPLLVRGHNSNSCLQVISWAIISQLNNSLFTAVIA